MQLTNPITDPLERLIDRAFAKLAVLGISPGKFLRQLFDNLISNRQRLERVAGFAFDRPNSSGLDFCLASGAIHNGKGVVGSNGRAAGDITIADEPTNYIEFDPIANGLVVNQDGFTEGHLPLHTAPVSESVIAPELHQDSRAAWAMLYGKQIAPGNIVDALGSEFAGIEFDIGTESGDTIAITLTLKDLNDNTVSETRIMEVWLADEPFGWLTTAAPSDNFRVGGAGDQLETLVTRKHLIVESDAGEVGLEVGDSGARTFYLHVLMDDGRIFVSDAIALT